MCHSDFRQRRICREENEALHQENRVVVQGCVRILQRGAVPAGDFQFVSSLARQLVSGASASTNGNFLDCLP